MKKKGSIKIKDIAIKCHLGITEKERSHAQRIYITCKFTGDFNISMKSDDISDTLNYSEVVKIIKNLVDNRSFNLIEHLAEKIYTMIPNSEKYESVMIEIKKPNALLDATYPSFTLYVE